MNSFEECRDVERISLEKLRPFIEQRAFNGQYVLTNKGPMAKGLQKWVGDLLFNKDADTVYAAEIKAETRNEHNNFFLETWSNRQRFTPGWMLTLKTDLLLYHFIEDDLLFALPFQALLKWSFHAGRIYDYPEKKQVQHKQLNDTWGRCVPIATVQSELKLGPPLRPVQAVQGVPPP